MKKVGTRGTLFTFYDLGIPTNVYIIHGDKYNYIIDTYLGPDIMKPIKQYIEEEYPKKPIIVINTHGHWDHVWGNSLFSNSLIIGHEKCKEYMLREGMDELERHAQYKKGEVVLTYPNLTFTDKIYFEEDNVLIYYTPGHTDDSISVLDKLDKVLYAGDNLERPVPYFLSENLSKHISTLQDYLNTNANIIIGGHTDCEDYRLVEDNIRYLESQVKK